MTCNAISRSLHAIGGTRQLAGNRSRVVGQPSVARMSVVKAGWTAATLGATCYSRMLGARVAGRSELPVAGEQQRTGPVALAVPRLLGAECR
jgi:hypothetical protein